MQLRVLEIAVGNGFSLGNEHRAVAVAEEAEVVAQSVVIDVVPALSNKGTDQQKQGALRLVEVCNHAAYNVVFVARCNDNLCAGVQYLLIALVHIVE